MWYTHSHDKTLESITFNVILLRLQPLLAYLMPLRIFRKLEKVVFNCILFHIPSSFSSQTSVHRKSYRVRLWLFDSVWTVRWASKFCWDLFTTILPIFHECFSSWCTKSTIITSSYHLTHYFLFIVFLVILNEKAKFDWNKVSECVLEQSLNIFLPPLPSFCMFVSIEEPPSLSVTSKYHIRSIPLYKAKEAQASYMCTGGNYIPCLN